MHRLHIHHFTLSDIPLHAYKKMISQILSNTGKVHDGLDPQSLQLCGVSDAGQ
jgi:hypothetical protein